MSESLFIYNERSGTYDPAVVSQIKARFADGGWPISHTRALAEGPLPDARQLTADGIGLVIVLGGDGSLAATAQALDGWEGTLLALPGGTMNLLARRLHGDLEPAEIVSAYLDGQGTVLNTPVIRANDITAYTGIMVGPTAAWGNVREALRNHDLAALAEQVPQALTATFEGPEVSLKGEDAGYPAIFIEPDVRGLRAHGVLADGARDLFRHGWAWLAGDFREGPSEPLGVASSLTVQSAARTLDLLIDGETAETTAPLDLHIARSGVRFFAAQGDTGWR